MKYVFTYILLCFAFLSYAQEDRVLVKGKVFINISEVDVSDIYVKNTTANYTTITDITGNFSIQAEEGDNILFQAYHIEDRNIKVSKTMKDGKKMSIYLNIKRKEIEPIVITPRKLYKSIDLEIKRNPMLNRTNKMAEKLGDLMPKEKLDGGTDLETEAAKKSRMSIDIGAIKPDKKLLAYEKQITVINTIKDYIGEKYFIDNGLEYDEINEFLHYAYLYHNLEYYYDNNNYFQIIDSIDKSIPLYKNRKQQNITTENNYNTKNIGEKYFPE